MRIGPHEAIVAAVIPAFNEEAAIGSVVRDALAEGVDEVLVVDGGSRDETVERARAAGARVIVEPRRGYGQACATGALSARVDADILVFLDGDGSDVVSFMQAIVGPVLADEADFVMGSRLRGDREAGAMTYPQIVAGWVSGALIRARYGARFTDMSPFRALRRDTLEALAMRETTFGWNLEMQMRVAALGLRILEIPVGCRLRRGGVSKVSGNAAAILPATWSIAGTFVRLARTLPRSPPRP